MGIKCNDEIKLVKFGEIGGILRGKGSSGRVCVYTEYDDDQSLDIQRSRLNIAVLMIGKRVRERKNSGLSLIGHERGCWMAEIFEISFFFFFRILWN
jgi:hypothetical protein